MSSNDTISEKLAQCVLKLHEVGVVKFGDFTLKSGMQSPVYFDLRIITSFPKLLCTVSELLWSVSPTKKFDHVCGVAYTGIPLATVISQMKDLPMVVRRKESKSYGTKKLVEGVYSPGESCLIVEDVLVSGSSVYETVETLRDLELEVTEAVVFLDREQGAVKNLSALGVNIVSVLTLTTMLSILQSHGRVSASVSKDVEKFISSHNNTSIVTQKLLQQTGADSTPCPRLSVPYSARARLTQHPVTRRLLTVMADKRTNLCVAADVDTAKELLAVAKEVGPHICLLKTHVDALDDFTPAVAEQLQTIAKEENFLLFEDSKFVDIGATVSRQYRRKALWADVVTAAPVLGGEGVLRGLAEGTGGCKDKGVILVTEMSSEGALRSADYSSTCLKYADDHPYLVLGFVSQTSATADPRLLQLTPGVHHTASGDSLGQRYVSPAVAVQQRGADIVIVGRGVTAADDRATAAKMYQTAAYEAYEGRLTVTDEQT